MFKNIPLEKFYRLINNGPCVLITSSIDKTNANIAPVAWTATINDEPPIVGIILSETHYTSELIIKSGEFVINIPDEKLLPAIMHTGKVSGKKENKFQATGLTPENGVKIETPHIKECIGYIECKVKNKLSYDGVILFIADVLYAQVKNDVFDEYWIPEKAKTVHHLGGAYFTLPGKRFKAI